MSDSKQDEKQHNELSRREFLTLAAGATAAPLLGSSNAEAATPQPAKNIRAKSTPKTGRNILFIFTDQERYIKQWPNGLVLPGHDRLKRTGTTFKRHYCPAVMCTSSRAVMMSGLQTADSRMFDNTDMPYVGAMSPKIPTIGHMLRKAGYYTAYKGKWHLDPAFDAHSVADTLLTKQMEGYGFADYNWVGDSIAHTHGGHNYDHMIASSAITWLRRKGRPLSDEGKPWSLFVSLVNPHDIMYFNTDAPDEKIQDTGKLMMRAARAPEHSHYRKTWNAPLPKNLLQPLDEAGRPKAHAEFTRAWGYTLGLVPMKEAPWKRFTDYYYNCISAVDAQLASILAELDALKLSDDTIIVFTSDHGEMAGSHGLRGKGPFAYEEVTHLPLHIVHPDVKGGQECDALTSHIDFVPSLLAMAGVTPDKAKEIAGRQLPGKDLSGLLADPAAATTHTLRDSVLYTYSGIATNDSELIRIIAEAKAAGQDPKAAVKASGYRPNMKKRGSLRCVFDGRYKFTRYFAPVERNQPTTLDELYRFNDVELFDLQNDPSEMHNLAAEKGKNAALVLAMNAKLNTIMQAEYGPDDGREMPKLEGLDWAISEIDL